MERARHGLASSPWSGRRVFCLLSPVARFLERQPVSEASEQIRVVQYCDLLGIPCFHVANERKCDPKTGAHLKRQGLKRGVPDLCIPRAKGRYHGLYIEMKDKGGKLTRDQLKWLRLLQAEGYCAFCCFGADDAIKLIDAYMQGTL